jgi:hypothetical protein
VNCPRWEDVRDVWEDDGALIEVSNSSMTKEDWQRVLALLHTPSWQLSWGWEEDKPLPSTPEDVIDVGFSRLCIAPGEGVDVYCYCHWTPEAETVYPNVFECDFWKNQIVGQAQLDTFCAFVQAFGRAVGKPLLVADEGLVHPIMRYEPATDELLRLVYEKPAGLFARARALLAARGRRRAS